MYTVYNYILYEASCVSCLCILNFLCNLILSWLELELGLAEGVSQQRNDTVWNDTWKAKSVWR